MENRVAIITGAGGGIGRATAVELQRRGFSTVLVGRTEKSLQETQRLASGALIVRADVTKPADVDAVVEQTLRTFSRVDAVVNNAGTAPVATIEQTTLQMWHDVIDTNLSAGFYLCRAVWPTFRKQQAGAVVNVSSSAARDPFPGFLAYGAAKAGVNTFGMSLAQEGEKIGVRVYTVAPGAVETAMLRGIFSLQQLPPQHALQPAEVAAVIGRCIAGDSQYKSGQVIWLEKQP